MCCYPRKLQTPNAKRRTPESGARTSAFALLLDDRGVAVLEGILVFALLAGVLLGCMLLGQWGTHLQYSQMGARLLAFDAGDISLAKLGKPGSQPVQTFSSKNWDTLAPGVNTIWLHKMYTLSNGDFSGSVSGTAHGRLQGQGPSLFDFAAATVGYHASGWAAASDPWGTPESLAQSNFIRIAYRVGLKQVSPSGLDSTYARPIPHGDTMLETIYGFVGQ